LGEFNLLLIAAMIFAVLKNAKKIQQIRFFFFRKNRLSLLALAKHYDHFLTRVSEGCVSERRASICLIQLPRAQGTSRQLENTQKRAKTPSSICTFVRSARGRTVDEVMALIEY
jgi:hypothetical protein